MLRFTLQWYFRFRRRFWVNRFGGVGFGLTFKYSWVRK